MNLFSLDGQVAIITGSSRGIGRAIALRMAEHGAKVVVSSRKVAACEEVVKTIQDKYGKDRAIAIAANISSKDDLANLVAETESHWGQVDVLVCNAASNPYYGPQAGITDEQFRKILDNNIVANHRDRVIAARMEADRAERDLEAIYNSETIDWQRGAEAIDQNVVERLKVRKLAQERNHV